MLDIGTFSAVREGCIDWIPQIAWYVIACAAVFPLEVAFGSAKKVTWNGRFGNACAMLVHFGVGGAVLGLLMATSAGQWLASYPKEPRHEFLRNPYVWALTSAFLVDAAFYAYHRLQHAVPLFWRIHKLHHTDPAMNVTTARRTHFLERGLQYFCLTIPMCWALGANPQGIAYGFAITSFFLYFGHADIRLDIGLLTPIVVGPLYHRIHHSRQAEDQNRNFAQVFPILDIVGGTYRRPHPDSYPETGVDGCETALARWRPLIW